MLKVFIILTIATVSLSLLKITSPIIKDLHNNQIPYSLANFGQIHYGTKLKGVLGVSQQSPNLCNPITGLNNSNTILLARRGQCSFVKKVYNAQKAGAKMVIVSDNIVQDSAHITMADDGNGRQIHIPSIFINEQNGEILQAQLHRSEVQLSIRFDIIQTDTVNLTLYLNVNDRHSAILVRELKQSVLQLKPHLNLNLSFFTQYCPTCKFNDCYFGDSNQCIYTKYNEGSVLVDIELKQYGIFLQNNEKWFQVYDNYDHECQTQHNFNKYSCLLTQISNAGATQLNTYSTLNKTTILQSWRQDALVSGIHTYPGVKINGVKYLGNVDSADVLEMVCASLKSPPETGCGQYDYLSIVLNKKSSHHVALVLWIVLTIFVTGCLIILAVFIYRKTIKKQITNEMSLKVTEMVSQYIKLASENDRKTRNKEIQNSREDL